MEQVYLPLIFNGNAHVGCVESFFLRGDQYNIPGFDLAREREYFFFRDIVICPAVNSLFNINYFCNEGGILY